jgi:hypothetical protein
VTAFGVAPRGDGAAPEVATLLEPISLTPELLAPETGFAQHERVRRGETLGSLMVRLASTTPSSPRSSDATRSRAACWSCAPAAPSRRCCPTSARWSG